jgi:hypothetical protein
MVFWFMYSNTKRFGERFVEEETGRRDLIVCALETEDQPECASAASLQFGSIKWMCWKKTTKYPDEIDLHQCSGSSGLCQLDS